MIVRVIRHNINGEKKVTSKSIYRNIPLYTLYYLSLFSLSLFISQSQYLNPKPLSKSSSKTSPVEPG